MATETIVLENTTLIVEENKQGLTGAQGATGAAGADGADGSDAEIPPAPTQVQAEDTADTSGTLYSWSVLRIKQLVTVLLNAWKTILGQRDILTSYTPANGSSTAINYLLGNAHYLDMSALTSSHAITLTASNWPAAATDYAAITLVLKTGATLPTITWPAGWVTLVPAVSKTSEYVVRSIGTAAPRLALVEAY